MLGIVAYDGSSDEDDDTSDTSDTTTNVKNLNTSQTSDFKEGGKFHISDDEDEVNEFTQCNSKQTDNVDINADTVSHSTVFSHLPEPVSHNLKSVPTLIAKPKVGSSGVKITIPSLDEFDEVEEDLNEQKKTKIKASIKGSGLFSLLPKPRNDFLATPRQVPNSAKEVSNKIKASNTLVPKQVVNRVQSHHKPKPSLIDYDSDGSDLQDDENQEDVEDESIFFTIPDKKEVEEVVLDKDIEEYMKPLVSDNIIVKSSSDVRVPNETNVHCDVIPSSSSAAEQTINMFPTGEENGFIPVPDERPIELNDDVIRKLGGRKRKGEDLSSLKLIDIDSSAVMPDSKEWLVKALSEETTYRPSHKKGDGPTSQQKRKHQITYLAHQAKANELDLKNQWASNRQSKRQTQSKYGF